MSRAVTDAEFKKEVLEAKGLSLVDFWAEWCGPCRTLSPKIEELAGQYQGKVNVFKMDVDSNQNIPAEYSVRGLPTVIFFKDGRVVDQVVGTRPIEAFSQVIKKHLGE